MPGYPLLPEMLGDEAGALAKQAEEAANEGRAQEAIQLYLAALSTIRETRVGLPGFVVGRLAMLYRRLRQYDSEVELLQDYQASHKDEKLAMRFGARLTKATAMAARGKSCDNGALASIRAVKARRPPKLPRSA